MAGQLGELFVKIRADTGEFSQGVDSAEKQTKQFSVKSAAALAGFAVAAVAAFRKISAAVRQSIQAYGRQIDAEVGLQAALRATGQEVDRLFPMYMDLASEIQELTTVGDEAALEMISLATSMGITEDQMEETIKGAIGLSDAFGIGTQQALRGVTNALQGNFEQLQRYIPALRTAETEAEKLAIVQEAMAGGFEVSQARAETAFGALQQYGNAVGDLQEQLGQNVAEGIEPFVRALTSFAQRVTSAIQSTREFRNILSNLQEEGETGSTSIEELTNTLNRLREAEERITKTGRERANENLGQIRQSINLIEEEIRALRTRERLQAQWGAGGAIIAEQRRQAAEIMAEALGVLEQREFDALSAQEQRLRVVQEEIDFWAKRREEIVETFGRESEYYTGVQSLINDLVNERNKLLETEQESAEVLEDVGEVWEDTASAIQQATLQQKLWNDELDNTEEKAKALQAEYEQLANIMLDYLGPTLESLGEALSGVEDGWVSLGQTAVRAIATIIRSLAREFAARAAGAFAVGNIPLGSALAGASGAALVASGIVNGLASQIQKAALGADFVTSGPQLLMVGDNPGGRERVSVEPLSSPNVNGPDDGPLYVQINLDGREISKFVTKAARSGQILVDQRAIV